MTDNAKPGLAVIHIPEPLIKFAYGQTVEYPRDGLYLYGPDDDPAHQPNMRYGVIGTKEGVRRFKIWSQQVAGFIPIPTPSDRTRAIEPQHIPFPGFSQAFSAPWSVSPHEIIETIDPTELSTFLRIANRYEAID